MGRRDSDADTAFKDAYWGLFVVAYRVARRLLGDEVQAEDVAAETLARTYAHWNKVGRLSYREAWVAKVATNAALDILRRKPLDLDVLGAIHQEDAVVTRLALVAALRALSRRQREVIVLRYLGGIDVDDIARSLSISPGSVRSHLQRGLEHLRDTVGSDATEKLDAV